MHEALFVVAYNFTVSLFFLQEKLLYRALTNEVFEEFRHWSYKVRTLRHLCPDGDDGTVCPACPKVGFVNRSVLSVHPSVQWKALAEHAKQLLKTGSTFKPVWPFL